MEDYSKLLEEKFQSGVGRTAAGDPQVWLSLKSGRSIEITFESDGLPEEDWYYSVRLHCSEAEFDRGEYESSMGIIDSLIGSCIDSAATALEMMLEMHDEKLELYSCNL